jgi:16S rRNA (adenine1518-N6/adenine1519-N6)-dimethyltransferase
MLRPCAPVLYDAAMTPLRAKRSLGQHWLTDGRVLRRIADAADFTDEDTVIEIGCGTGRLTSLLAERARRLVGVEIDEDLVNGLRERFADATNVSIVSADVMSITAEELLETGRGGAPYVVVGNLPYNIGTALVARFLQARTRPRWLLVMLQAQVAESMVAADGKMSYLSVITRLFAKPRLLFYVPARAFRPPPKVQSAVVRLDVREEPLVPDDERDGFIELAQAGFAAPRKRVRNSLAIGLRATVDDAEALLANAGIDPTVRPAEIGIDGWIALHWARQTALAGAGGA